MSRRHPRWTLVVGTLAVLCASGCSHYPPPPQQADVSPREAGRQAIAEYDANQDGKLDGTEISKSPPLKYAMQKSKDEIDTNGDGMLSADEIAARIDYWLHSGTIVISCNPLVTIGGRPLAGATVTFEPEEFLGPGYTACEGVTDAHGFAYVKGPDPMYPGIHLGFYRVKISRVVGGRETIASRYNSSTELGYEARPYQEGIGNLEFHLSGR
jgi:hypothetical protein